jgi:hypothetical protein
MKLIDFSWLFSKRGSRCQDDLKPNLDEVSSSDTAMMSSSYEFMLENLLDVPTDRFDGWRNRKRLTE